MGNDLKSWLGDVRLETIAAVALLIQAFILWLLWRMLSRHSATMERQAETANLLGYVLEQQTKIMEEQLTLHSRIEAKMERERIFDAVLGLQAKVADLTAELSPPPQMLTATEEQQRISDKWIRLEDAIPPCLTGLITATHLSPEEKDYCIHFALDLDAITKMRSVNTPQMNINGLRAISQTYNDLATKLDQSVHR